MRLLNILVAIVYHAIAKEIMLNRNKLRRLTHMCSVSGINNLCCKNAGTSVECYLCTS